MYNVFGTRPIQHKMSVLNVDTAQIDQGKPVVLKMDGTLDGAACVKPSTVAAALAHATLLGIARTDIPAKSYGEVVVYGFVKDCYVIKQSRAASTDSFNSHSAGDIGDKLQLDPVNNGLFLGGAAAAADSPPYAALMESFASGASSASTSSNSSLVVADKVQVWIRLM